MSTERRWAKALSLSGDLSKLLEKICTEDRPTDVEELDNCRSAIRSVMGSRPRFINDDGTIWPMVPGEEFWTGPLRINGKYVEQLRFFPERDDHENLEWIKIAKVTT